MLRLLFDRSNVCLCLCLVFCIFFLSIYAFLVYPMAHQVSTKPPVSLGTIGATQTFANTTAEHILMTTTNNFHATMTPTATEIVQNIIKQPLPSLVVSSVPPIGTWPVIAFRKSVRVKGEFYMADSIEELSSMIYKDKTGPSFQLLSGSPEALMPPGTRVIVSVASGGVRSEVVSWLRDAADIPGVQVIIYSSWPQPAPVRDGVTPHANWMYARYPLAFQSQTVLDAHAIPLPHRLANHFQDGECPAFLLHAAAFRGSVAGHAFLQDDTILNNATRHASHIVEKLLNLSLARIQPNFLPFADLPRNREPAMSNILLWNGGLEDAIGDDYMTLADVPDWLWDFMPGYAGLGEQPTSKTKILVWNFGVFWVSGERLAATMTQQEYRALWIKVIIEPQLRGHPGNVPCMMMEKVWPYLFGRCGNDWIGCHHCRSDCGKKSCEIIFQPDIDVSKFGDFIIDVDRWNSKIVCY